MPFFVLSYTHDIDIDCEDDHISDDGDCDFYNYVPIIVNQIKNVLLKILITSVYYITLSQPFKH